jgi:AraC-like DNA-binding protein
LPYFFSSPTELLFHYQGNFSELLAGDRIQSSFVTGIHAQTNQYRRFITNGPFGIFGVYLYPHAIPALFGIPGSELTNHLPDLLSLLKQSERDIDDSTLSAKDNEERYRLITKFLENKVKRFERPEIAFAVKTIVDCKGQLSIKQLSSHCHTSLRQFERNFTKQIGFTPKLFSRIIRFNSVLGQSNSTKKSLTEIAHHFGYYDQSHFIQDFREFSGYNPSTYFSGKTNEVFNAF